MQVYSRLSPFTSETNYVVANEGATVSELMELAGVSKRMQKYCHVTVSGHTIPQENWTTVRPKEHTQVRIYATPQGGGGGGKGVIGAVLVVAAIALTYGLAAVPITSYGAVVGTSYTLFGASISATAFSALSYAAYGLAIVGLSMVSSSFAPKLPELSGYGGGATTSNTYSISGSSNQSNPYGPIPKVYGKHKVFPLVCANVFTEQAGDDEYLNMLLTFGRGPLTISDLQIGTNPIEWYDDVEYEFREGRDDDDDLTLYKDSVLQDSYSVTLLQDDARTFRSRVDADEVSIDIQFPRGLATFSDSGSTGSRSVQMKFEYRLVGDTEWTVFGSNTTVCSEYETVTNYFAGEDLYSFDGFTYSLVYSSGQSLSTIVAPQDLYRYDDNDEAYFFVVSSGQNIPQQYYTTSTSTNCIATEPATIYTDATSSSFSESVRFVAPVQGQYDVRVTRITANSASLQVLDETTFTTLRTFKYVNPVNEPNISLLALRIKATDQLNGVIDNLNAIVYGEVRKWDGVSLGDYEHSRNPAWAYLDTLLGLSTKNPVSTSRIDLDGLLDWANDCDVLDTDGNPMYQYDAVIDYSTTLFDLLGDITTSGRAAFGMRSGRFSVVQDKSQTIVRDIYTPRNTNSFRGTKAMVESPHAVRARFISPELDYEQDELVVYADGYDETNATEFEEHEWIGVTESAQVYRLTRYLLACILLRPESFSLNVSIDGFVIERGDLVEVAHDVPLLGGTPALIKDVTVDGGNVTHFILDDFVEMESGKEYGVRIRDLEGNVSTYQIVTNVGETKTVELQTPILVVDAPQSQSVTSFGEYSQETFKAIVQKIERAEELTAKVTLLPYSEAVYSSETEAIPPYDPQINYQGNEYVPTQVQNLSASERAIGGAQYDIRLDLSWQPPQEGGSFSYEVYRFARGKYRLYDITSSTNWSYPKDVNVGTVEKFAVVAVSSFGRKLPISQASSIAYSVDGITPPDVDSFDADVIGDNIILSWDISNDTYVYDYEIKHSALTTGAVWQSAVDVQIVASPTKTVSLPVQTGTYLIKARDYLGNESENALSVINTVIGASDINVIQTITESPTWLGVKDNVEVDSGKLQLAIDALFDDVVSVDDIIDFDTLDGELASSGTYYFEDTFDLGAVYTSRLTSSISVTGLDLNDTLDSWIDVDSRAYWDGSVPSQYSVNLLVRTTDNDPTGTPVWSEWRKLIASDYTARAFQFRLDLISLQSGVTPVVSELSVSIDMPDRIERFSDVTSGTVTKTIIYGSPFWDATGNPTITLSINDMASSDYYTITNKSNTGFDITFYDSSNTIISKVFDVVAAGFGREN